MTRSAPVDEGHARRFHDVDPVPAGHGVSTANQEHLPATRGHDARTLGAAFEVRCRNADELNRRTTRARAPGSDRGRGPGGRRFERFRMWPRRGREGEWIASTHAERGCFRQTFAQTLHVRSQIRSRGGGRHRSAGGGNDRRRRRHRHVLGRCRGRGGLMLISAAGVVVVGSICVVMRSLITRSIRSSPTLT